MKRLVILFLFLFITGVSFAQFTDCTSGLLSIPSAEMKEEGTVSITNVFINRHNLCPPYDGWHGWEYNTFGYGVGITFWKRLEIDYVCVLFNGKWSRSGGQPDWFHNQDRHFSAKFQLLREGDFFPWMPSCAVGIGDPVTGAGGGQYIGSDVSSGNGYFNRMYVAFAKNFETPYGKVGAHLLYQHSLRSDYIARGPCLGLTWNPVWVQNIWFNPRFIVEYDARYINMGFIASCFKDRMEAMFELQNFKWVSFGLRYNIALLNRRYH